jgi:hypothetical protein
MKNVKAMNEVKKLMFDLDQAQLSELVQHFKNCRSLLNMKAKSEFSVGQKVKFGKFVGIISKLNRTKAVVSTATDGKWNVPMTRMEAI